MSLPSAKAKEKFGSNAKAKIATVNTKEEIRRYDFAYQSECGDHRWQAGQQVKAHFNRQLGQTPPVSKVFHWWPH
jgi:hypothetical protein